MNFVFPPCSNVMGKDLEAGVLLTRRESHRITLSDMCGSRPACVHI